jgi:hypothetical protein
MIAAIEKGYIKFPHLSANTVRQHRPNSIATAKGHLDQTRQGQRSTESALHHVFNDEDEVTGDIFPATYLLPLLLSLLLLCHHQSLLLLPSLLLLAVVLTPLLWRRILCWL